MNSRLLVVYGKVVDDAKFGIILTGVFFGGLAASEQEADQLATKCVSSVQGGTGIPKISQMRGTDLRAAIKDAEHQFNRMADRWYDNEKIIR